MGGKKNKNKKHLQNKHNAKRKKTKQGKNDDTHLNMISPQHNKQSKNNKKQTKKAKDLFNAGINALNEAPEIDVGLTYHRSDGYNPNFHGSQNNDYFSDEDDFENASTNDLTEDNDISDVMSLQSEVTILDDEILHLQDNDHLIDNEIDDLLDDLTNKDSQIRIQSLNKLNNSLRTRQTNESDFTDKNQRLQLVSKYLLLCIRRGSVNEQLHALDTIALLSLSLEDGIDFFVKYFQITLKNLIQRPKSAVVQTKAMSTWAIMVWSLGEPNTTIASLKLFEFFWNYNLKERDSYYQLPDVNEIESEDEYEEEEKEKPRASKEILVEAIDSWLFLITSIGSSTDIGSLLDTYCHSLLSLIQMNKTGVTERVHIGKALTVLINNYDDAMENDDEFEEQDVDLEAVMNEFEHLKSNSKQHKKREFLVQKAKFRDYLKTLEHKWTPIIMIKLHHKHFELSGWNQWVQYHAIKGVLKNGLQAHLLQNNKIKQVFEIEIDAVPMTLSKKQKKKTKWENTVNQKNIKQKRAKNRDKKRSFIFDKSLVD